MGSSCGAVFSHVSRQSSEDLSAGFLTYGRACRHASGGRGLGLPGFHVSKASAFLSARRPDGTLGPAEEGPTRELVGRLNALACGLDFDYPQPGYSNVMPTGWSKASGIRALVEAMGISMEQVVVFGDAGNDVPMFEAVPNSVAVANATDEAAAAARWHIGACEDDAVAEAIERLAAGEWPFVE
jgi:hypothetical protein